MVIGKLRHPRGLAPASAEALLSASNVPGLRQSFQAKLPAIADGAPLYVSNVSTLSGTKDLLFVTTETGDIIALDAHTGAQVWIDQNPANGCSINNGSSPCYTTSSPVLDPNRQYVYSYGLDGKVHKYQVGDGAEITTGGWPETATIKDFDEKGSSALAVATAGGVSYLYVTNSGYPGDGGNYQGHVTAINLANGNPLDSYTPANFQSLQNNDQDLGSTDVAILPVPSGSNVAHLAIQGGKDAKLRLLNLDNLSGQGGLGHTGGEITTINVPQGNEVLTQSAVWLDGSGTTWVFVANDNGISGLKLTLTNGTPGLQKVWQSGSGGTSPIVANGVLYDAGSGAIRALNPGTGKQLWQGSIGGIHWQSPIVANGILYIADNNSYLTAFAVPAYPTPNPNLTPQAYLPLVGN